MLVAVLWLDLFCLGLFMVGFYLGLGLLVYLCLGSVLCVALCMVGFYLCSVSVL